MAEPEIKSNTDNEISLRDVVLKVIEWKNYLKAKWRVILIMGLVGVCAGLTYSIVKKTIYIADCRFALEDEKSSGGLGGALGLASQFGIDLGNSGGGAFSGDNLLELMRSRFIVEKTLLTPVTIDGKKQTLAEYYIQFNDLRNKWDDNKLKEIHFLNDTSRSGFSLQKDSLLGEFYKKIVKENLNIDKVDKKLSILYVRVSSTNELFAKYFTEVLVDNVSEYYINIKTQKSSRNVSILQRQRDSVRYELNHAIKGVASTMDTNPNVNPNLQVLKVPSQHRQVDVQANTIILGELEKNLEIAKVSLRKETPLVQIIDRPILPLEKVKIGKIKGVLIGSVIMVIIGCLALTFRFIMKNILE